MFLLGPTPMRVRGVETSGRKEAEVSDEEEKFGGGGGEHAMHQPPLSPVHPQRKGCQKRISSCHSSPHVGQQSA